MTCMTMIALPNVCFCVCSVSTAGLLMLLSKTYPDMFVLFLLLLMLDVFSHWFQMYSTLVAGSTTHKVRIWSAVRRGANRLAPQSSLCASLYCNPSATPLRPEENDNHSWCFLHPGKFRMKFMPWCNTRAVLLKDCTDGDKDQQAGRG